MQDLTLLSQQNSPIIENMMRNKFILRVPGMLTDGGNPRTAFHAKKILESTFTWIRDNASDFYHIRNPVQDGIGDGADLKYNIYFNSDEDAVQFKLAFPMTS